MRKKTGTIFITAILIVHFMSGCTLRKPAEETMPSFGAEQAISKDPTEQGWTPVSVIEQTGGKKLSIDVQVQTANWKNLATIQLIYDEDKLNTMAEYLIFPEFPNAKLREIHGRWGWWIDGEDHTLLYLDCDPFGSDSGEVDYLDVRRDLNSQIILGENAYKPYYFTEHIPYKMDQSSTEAAEQAAAFLSQYSCFTYHPWNVTAGSLGVPQEIPGYYSIHLQPYYDDLPVYGNYMRMSAAVSCEGLFAFQGPALLKEQERQAIQHAMSLDMAVERFKKDFSIVLTGDCLIVDRIAIGYLGISNQHGVHTLSPAWVFECQDVSENANDQDNYYCAYLIETGEFQSYRW